MNCDVNTKRNMTLLMCKRQAWKRERGEKEKPSEQVTEEVEAMNDAKLLQVQQKPHRWAFSAVMGKTCAIWLFHSVRCEYFVNMNKTFMLPGSHAESNASVQSYCHSCEWEKLFSEHNLGRHGFSLRAMQSEGKHKWHSEMDLKQKKNQ